MIARALRLSSALLLPWAGPDGAIGPNWHEQRYAGRTHYAPMGERGTAVIRAESEGQNSALLTRVAMDPSGVRLHWRWRVLQHPAHADPEVRARDDRARAFGARQHRIEAVGVLCDSDNTGSKTEAEFGALELGMEGAAEVPR